MGYLSFVDLKSQARSVSHLVAATQSTATFSGDGQDAERVNAMRVSRGYFDMVGVQPSARPGLHRRRGHAGRGAAGGRSSATGCGAAASPPIPG